LGLNNPGNSLFWTWISALARLSKIVAVLSLSGHIERTELSIA
jgi:hypothetical protein